MPKTHGVRRPRRRSLVVTKPLLAERIIPDDRFPSGVNRLGTLGAVHEFQTAAVRVFRHDVPSAARVRAVGDARPEARSQIFEPRSVCDAKTYADKGWLALRGHPGERRVAVGSHVGALFVSLQIEQSVVTHEGAGRIQVRMTKHHIFDVLDAHADLPFRRVDF